MIASLPYCNKSAGPGAIEGRSKIEENSSILITRPLSDEEKKAGDPEWTEDNLRGIPHSWRGQFFSGASPRRSRAWTTRHEREQSVIANRPVQCIVSRYLFFPISDSRSS